VYSQSSSQHCFLSSYKLKKDADLEVRQTTANYKRGYARPKIPVFARRKVIRCKSDNRDRFKVRTPVQESKKCLKFVSFSEDNYCFPLYAVAVADAHYADDINHE